MSLARRGPGADGGTGGGAVIVSTEDNWHGRDVYPLRVEGVVCRSCDLTRGGYGRDSQVAVSVAARIVGLSRIRDCFNFGRHSYEPGRNFRSLVVLDYC